MAVGWSASFYVHISGMQNEAWKENLFFQFVVYENGIFHYGKFKQWPNVKWKE